MHFYRCPHCNNTVTFLTSSQAPLCCCGQRMMLLRPGTDPSLATQHVPIIQASGDITVKISTLPHPMVPEHYIEWIILHTKKGFQTQQLCPGMSPEAVFRLAPGDEVVDAYCYCNIHWLWKSDIRGTV